MARVLNPENGATSCTGRDVSLGVAFLSSFKFPNENTALSGHFFRNGGRFTPFTCASIQFKKTVQKDNARSTTTTSRRRTAQQSRALAQLPTLTLQRLYY